VGTAAGTSSRNAQVTATLERHALRIATHGAGLHMVSIAGTGDFRCGGLN